jgi:hypothetical protein
MGEWKIFARSLDIYTEIIVNIRADLQSSRRLSSRMAEGSDSQSASYRDILQWIAAQLNRTNDDFQKAATKLSGSPEESWVGCRETEKRIGEFEEQFRVLLSKVATLRHALPNCSQRTMGALCGLR